MSTFSILKTLILHRKASNSMLWHIYLTIFFITFRWIFPKPGRLIAPVATSMKSSRWRNTKSLRNQNSLRVGDVTIVSSKVSEVSPSPSWGRRPRRPRSWCCVSSAESARGVNKFPSSAPSISSWEATRNVRDKWSNSKGPIHSGRLRVDTTFYGKATTMCVCILADVKIKSKKLWRAI